MTAKSQVSSWALYKRLLGYLAPQWKIFSLALVSMILAAATEPAFAYLMKPLIDQGFVGKSAEAMYQLPLMIIGLFVIRGVASYVNEYLTSRLSMDLVLRLRCEMFGRMTQLPSSYYANNNSGRIMSRIGYDADNIAQAGFNVITVVVKDSVILIGLFAQLLWLDWQLTLVCLGVMPMVALVIRVVSKRLRRLSSHSQEMVGQMNQVVSEAVEGNRVIKVYQGESYENARFAGTAGELARTNVKQTATSAANTAVTQFLIAFALAIIIFFAMQRAQRNDFTAGSFMAFMTAMLMLLPSVKRITSVTQLLQRGLAAAESVFSFLDQLPEPDHGTKHLATVRGELSFQQLNFAYPGAERKALADINLHIPAGKTVALVGSSGSGKTTLANLVPRFYLPDSGEIQLDGVPLNELTLAGLRENLALVSQDVVLFNDTVAANIAYGRRDVSQEQILEAARAANALEFIEAMPDGFATLIGENGARLSGGQRQRLAIARAVLKNAPILILDEATSALDTQSERLVQGALDNLMKNRTTLVIAHRLSTIENADCIVVMQQGSIVEQGTHQELLAAAGVYANLHSMQFKENH